MSETIRQRRSNELSEIYAQLNKEDIEQFYAGYQWWILQQRATALQEHIESQRRQIAENTELIQLVHPPAIALATMARLQASGVNDIGLLDRMLERGEDWLDRTMQRLNYCEQLEFILDDYTQWCQNALDGAYDWIDSMREGGPSSSAVPGGDTSIETTEELLLQKLTSEEEETPASDISTEQSDHEDALSTLERAINPAPAVLDNSPAASVPVTTESPIELSATSDSEQPVIQEYNKPSTAEMEAATESDLPVMQDHDNTTEMEAATESDQLTSQVYIDVDPTPEELPPVEGNDDSNVEQIPLQAHSEDGLATAQPLLTTEEFPTYREEFLAYSGYQPDEQPGIELDRLEDAEQDTQVARHRRNFLQRLARNIWRS